ncbi:hypothetical protein J6590_033650 [Homalodisca vitripennis]|nr:hypothetical protein J6590_033650 [Homalodisca vitripennis]
MEENRKRERTHRRRMAAGNMPSGIPPAETYHLKGNVRQDITSSSKDQQDAKAGDCQARKAERRLRPRRLDSE